MKVIQLSDPARQIGDITHGEFIGKTKYNKYIWQACVSCGQERWVEYRILHPRSALCLQCVNKLGLNKRKDGKPNGWKSGITTNHGYVMVYSPEHPNAVSEYVKRARLEVEKQIGRYLLPREHVHHINGVKTDDRIINLQIMTIIEHRRLHASGVICSEETKRKISIAQKRRWYAKKHSNP